MNNKNSALILFQECSFVRIHLNDIKAYNAFVYNCINT